MTHKKLQGTLALVLFQVLAISAAVAEPVGPFDLPGSAAGSGTVFQVTDSDYLNVTLQSSTSVSLRIQSAASMVVIFVDEAESAGSTQMTLGGLAPLTTYYKYVDDFHGGVAITSDESGSYTWQQDLSAGHHVWFQPNPSTKFIRDDPSGGDCLSVGNWDPATKTCTLTQDVFETIQVDGAGHTLQGAGSGYGIYFTYRMSVTVKDLEIRNFSHGVHLYQSDYITLEGITFREHYIGVYVYIDNYNQIVNNLFTDNRHGIYVDQWSTHNTIAGNTISNGSGGDGNSAVAIYYSPGTTVTGNTISNVTRGLRVSNSAQTKVYNNNFVDVPVLPYLTSSAVTFSLAAPVGGNFWSNWTTPDLNGDGFVDSPHVFPGGVDNLPWATQSGWDGPPPDSDDDGVVDDADNCPGASNPDQSDLDGDGLGDVCDADLDGDGFENAVDNCPMVVNAEQSDLDSDGLGDACDPDLDGDGIPNVNDNCVEAQNPEQIDTDLDGLGNECDADDDNDAVLDGDDNCPFNANAEQFDLDGDGLGDVCDADLDGDGVLNEDDNCEAEPNPYQDNTDGDTQGDACDVDDDNDGICDTDQGGGGCNPGPDNCSTVANPNQEDFDGDTIGDVCDADVDGDGIGNDVDNCMWVANPAQDDTDFDTDGDACDPDDDNDSWLDGDDNCPLVANVDQSDLDADGLGDACDADLDSDGWDNGFDNCPLMANSGQADLDGDGLGDACDPDVDDDGVLNANDICAATPPEILVDPGNGCSIEQLCPCDGPRGTNQAWKNHGKYVSCNAHATESFLDLGLITAEEKGELVSEAAQSECGSKK